MLVIFGGGGVAQGIQSVWPGECRILERTDCDVTDRAQVALAFDAFSPQYVVNCAGVSQPSNPQLEVEVNLIGALNVALCSHVPTVLIASVSGLYGKPGHVGYCASKAGVISVVQSLACEGREIWAVSPGRVDTKMRERDYPADTPGSRLDPQQVGFVVRDCLQHLYTPGTNVVIRKQGLVDVILTEHKGDGWKETLRVGQPLTI